MKKQVLCWLILLCSYSSYAQIREVKYYNNEWLSREVPEKKAKFSLSIIDRPDSSVTREIKNLKTGEIIDSKTYKGEEPVGKWIYRRDNRTDELDYSFELKYQEKHCRDSIPGIKDFSSNNDSLQFVAPVLEEGIDLMKFIVKHIVYPAEAKDQGIMGRVFIGFTLTEKGEVENVVVLRGKHILLDKEAVRVIRKLKFKNPAQSKGEGKRVCLALPISFHLR